MKIGWILELSCCVPWAKRTSKPKTKATQQYCITFVKLKNMKTDNFSRVNKPFDWQLVRSVSVEPRSECTTISEIFKYLTAQTFEMVPGTSHLK